MHEPEPEAPLKEVLRQATISVQLVPPSVDCQTSACFKPAPPVSVADQDKVTEEPEQTAVLSKDKPETVGAVRSIVQV